jgi:hypothetical protein
MLTQLLGKAESKGRKQQSIQESIVKPRALHPLAEKEWGRHSDGSMKVKAKGVEGEKENAGDRETQNSI